MLPEAMFVTYQRLQIALSVDGQENMHKCRKGECFHVQFVDPSKGDVFECTACGDRHCIRCVALLKVAAGRQ